MLSVVVRFTNSDYSLCVLKPQALVSFKKYMLPPLPKGAYIFLMKQVPVLQALLTYDNCTF